VKLSSHPGTPGGRAACPQAADGAVGTQRPADARENGRLLVVGGEGLLGGALLDSGRREGLEVCATMQHADDPVAGIRRLDLAGPVEGWSLPRCSSAVLCAAITSLDACRRDPAGTRHINVSQTVRLADRLVSAGAFVVFVSSNLVFDGAKPCRPAADALCPETEYGRQKAEAERALAAFGESVAVVRLTKVVSPKWTLMRGWIEAWRSGRMVEAFADMVGAPIPLEVTVKGVLAVTHRRLAGIWQFSAATDVSYAEMARHLARRVGANAELVRDVSARTRVSLEHLPEHTTLDASRATRELGLRFPPPLEAVAAQCASA